MKKEKWLVISFVTGTTPEATAFVNDNLKRIGTLESITHERNQREMYYKTVFHGTEKEMAIFGGLTSGYVGSGPDGLFGLLLELGVPEEVAQKEVYKEVEEEYSFEIEL